MRSRRATSDSPWERTHGYARAVRRGNVVAVSPIAACDADGRVVGSDALAQGRAIFARLARVLGEVGAALEDVVRLRVYYVGGDVAEGFMRAFHETFEDAVPALTTVHVVSLSSAEFLLEVEADAVLADAPRSRADEPVWEEQGD